MDPILSEAISAEIEQAQRVLLVTHVGPDGDAIGSLLGLGALLEAQGKEVTLACEDPVPESYRFLPGSDAVVQATGGRYDLLVSLDCSDQRRMGDVVPENLAGLPLINIDHHLTNSRFGTINWVDASAVATTQMVLALAEALGWRVTRQVAICLLNGLVTDTRSFRTSNVDLAAMRAVLRLMEAGASLPEIARQALEQRPLASVRLWADAVEDLRLEDGILWTSVTLDMRQRHGMSENDFSGLANSLSGIREASAVVVFTEREDGLVDVGMRASPGLNVAGAALRLGGGGHPQAAGCTLEGDLRQVQDRVLAEVRRSLSERVANAQ
ncbi:MAG: bifunctional oligoribonuclease/PAP phosphatase NrnA [Anaerolineae bacterium]|nr:bifunctional oligoribonuclease/PAP phosphatase NrnA [Anaerolineae bacterium]